MNKVFVCLFLVVISLLHYSCYENSQAMAVVEMPTSIDKYWEDYWYDGNAEVSSYQLKQSRYGETRLGHSILVFVTEDFSKSKQVKLDNPINSGGDKISVLKSNIIRKFNTGIYDYSMMASVFTPISYHRHPNTAKVTMSSQDWCGQSFTQINYKNDTYEIDEKSYFEFEGDRNINLEADWLEDEIWNRLRIDPDKMPIGELLVIPGTFYSRLRHQPFMAQKAQLTRKVKDQTISFELDYHNIDRSLSITIENLPPYRILHWEEIYDGNLTNGKLMQTMHIPYWKMNGNKFESYRDSLMIN